MKIFRFVLACAAILASGVQGVAQSEGVGASDAQTLVVPAGTVIPLTLVDGIKAKSTPLGGTVRATVAFPVTVGTKLAIPAGVYAEGQLVQSQFPKHYKQPKGAPPVSPLQVHFTKLIYPNGYTVALDAQVSAEMLPMDSGAKPGVELATLEMPELGRGFGVDGEEPLLAMMGEPQTTYPPLPSLPAQHVGPNPVEIIVPTLAVTAALVTTAVLLGRHNSGKFDSVLFAPGYAFQMTLAAPVTLDRTQVVKAAALSDPGGQ